MHDILWKSISTATSTLEAMEHSFFLKGHTEPLGGVRHVSVRDRRTAADWAQEIKYLADVCYPDAEKIILVLDNLNTHTLGSLYKAFPAAEARRIAKRFEIHFTPKHGSLVEHR